MKDKMKKLLLVLALLFFAVMAVLSGCQIYSILAEYRQEEAISGELQQYIIIQSDHTDVTRQTVPAASGEAVEETPEPEDPYPYPVVDFDALKEINDDVVGWILIEDTKINYPIVQGTDNQRYINHMADGTWNPAGSIFMDYRNESDFSDPNTVLYGHNMKNGSMFKGIMDYRKQGFLEEHPTGVILTPEKNFRFEIVAGYVAQLSDPAWQLSFESDEEFDEWLQKTMARSIIGGSFELDPTDRVITLSTCSYDFDDARFVLICRIIQ